jgi:hypothetical protein
MSDLPAVPALPGLQLIPAPETKNRTILHAGGGNSIARVLWYKNAVVGIKNHDAKRMRCRQVPQREGTNGESG